MIQGFIAQRTLVDCDEKEEKNLTGSLVVSYMPIAKELTFMKEFGQVEATFIIQVRLLIFLFIVEYRTEY
jgi:hypothetical protein